MIYFFYGSDVGKTRAKAFQWVKAAREKQPDVPYLRIPAEELTPEALQEATGSQGLFFLKSLVILDDPFSDTKAGELVMKELEALKASENVIGILAPKLIPARVKKIEAHAAKSFASDLSEKKPARGFNSALVNALAARDSKTLWKEIVKAERAGDAPEMIHGLLHWKARDLMEKGGRGWSPEEARVLSRRLIELVSEARSGGPGLGMRLERFALSL